MSHAIPAHDLLSLASEYGLPLFVYDADEMTHQVNVLKKAFTVPSLDIRYACKALSTIGVLKHLANNGCGIDAVSPGEITAALRAGISPERISFTPSGVLLEEYAFAIQHNIHIHVDQLHVLEWLSVHFPGTPVTLRFNPGIRAGSHEKLQVGSSDSKFGFPAHLAQSVADITQRLSIPVVGVHMHLGSDIGDSQSFDRAYDFLLDIALFWKETLRHIDLGGGFKVPYHPEDHSIDIIPFGEKITTRFIRFCDQLGRDIRLVLEPGKFLVSEAGKLLMEVTGIRESPNHPMVYVQSGFNHFLRPMSYGAYHHIINLSNPSGEVRQYDVVGNLCETDTFATARPLNNVRVGDVLCLFNAGAYGYTMASNYNSRPKPAEVLWSATGHKLIRRAEIIEDLLRTDLEA